jgi:hypothetical protein
MAAYTSNMKNIYKVDHSKSHWTDSLYYRRYIVPKSGIYKCQGCNKEITSNKDDPFPPQNKHQHTDAQAKSS